MGDSLKGIDRSELSGCCIVQGVGGSLLGMIGVAGNEFILSGRQWKLECTSSKYGWKQTVNEDPNINRIPSCTSFSVIAMVFFLSFVLIFTMKFPMSIMFPYFSAEIHSNITYF